MCKCADMQMCKLPARPNPGTDGAAGDSIVMRRCEDTKRNVLIS
jgi:hypothetical protein